MTNNIGSTHEQLIARIKAILLKSREEWPVIAAEPSSIGTILTGYALPLAAIGPVAGLVGGQIFGFSALGITYHPSLTAGITTAVISFILSLVSLFVLTAIVQFLAPKFDGSATRLAAFKLVAYSMTASWLAGIFGIVPSLGVLGLLGLYSLYLLYTGVTPLVNVPSAKAATFTIVTVICGFVLIFLAGIVAASVTHMFAGPALTGADNGAVSGGELSGNVAVPGLGTIDVAKMQAAARKAEATTRSAGKAADAAALQTLLPPAVAGFNRVSVESQALGQAGSNAEGRYEKDGKSFTLSVTDMAAMGSLSAMGAAMGMSSNKEDADGYEKTTTVDGRIVTEKWNRTNSIGEYGTTLADRFMVKAQGEVNSIETLKAAVGSIDADTLESLVK